jgi:hypothetical protein
MGHNVIHMMKTYQSIINKTKHQQRGKKVQDGKTRVLANKEFSKKGRLLGEKIKSNIQTP